MTRPAFSRLPVTVNLPLLLQVLAAGDDSTARKISFHDAWADCYRLDWSNASISRGGG